jgi:hypothetical protein
MAAGAIRPRSSNTGNIGVRNPPADTGAVGSHGDQDPLASVPGFQDQQTRKSRYTEDSSLPRVAPGLVQQALQITAEHPRRLPNRLIWRNKNQAMDANWKGKPFNLKATGFRKQFTDDPHIYGITLMTGYVMGHVDVLPAPWPS